VERLEGEAHFDRYKFENLKESGIWHLKSDKSQNDKISKSRSDCSASRPNRHYDEEAAGVLRLWRRHQA
jgi:hypothetical protein